MREDDDGRVVARAEVSLAPAHVRELVHRGGPLEIARFMGHAKVATTLGFYAHLFEDDHAEAMAALCAWTGSRRSRATSRVRFERATGIEPA
jgi:hypothetical protein